MMPPPETATEPTLEALADQITTALRTDEAQVARERCTLALRSRLQSTKPQSAPEGLFAQTQGQLF